MRKLAIMSIALTLVCASVFATKIDFPICAKTLEKSSISIEVINLCQLTEDDLNEILLGHHLEIAVEFSAQTTVPLSFFLKGGLVNLVGQDVNVAAIEIQETFYGRRVQEEFIFSTNLRDWKPFSEFVTGNVSVTMKIQDGKPSLVVGAEVNQR